MKNLYLIYIVGLLSFSLISCNVDPVPVPVDCTASDLSLEVSNTTTTECNNPTGSATVSANGGSGDYKFRITGGAFQESNIFGNLGSGLFTITVKDGNNCETETEVTIRSSTGPSILEISTVDSGCGESGGSMTISAEGGTGDISFKLNDDPFESSPVFSNLEAGTYDVTVRDSNGCESTSEVMIKSGTPFATIKDVISQNCAVSGCHVSGNGTPNFTLNSTIVSEADNILTQVSNGIMPPSDSGQSITQEEIDLIACWVSDGANL